MNSRSSSWIWRSANSATPQNATPACRQAGRGSAASTPTPSRSSRATVPLLGSEKAPGARGMLLINGYRIALGLSPLVLNTMLMKVADGHSAEMKELNFYSNDSPTPGRRTEKDRAALAGYTDPVTQFIHTGSTITGALPVWIASAIHHRLMAGTEFIEAGFGVCGPPDAGARDGGEAHSAGAGVLTMTIENRAG